MKTELKCIGIDVSKATLDICIQSQEQSSFVIKNTRPSIIRFFKKHLNADHANHICLENTGKYSWELVRILSELPCQFYVVNPLHLKRSLGLVRGKNDKVDAIRIASFIRKNYQELTPYIAQRDELQLIQMYLSERRFKVQQRKKLKTKNKENLILSNKKVARKFSSRNNQQIKLLDLQIKELEREMNQLISQDSSLNELQKQIKSVPGVGDVLCWYLLVKTNEFKTISDPRKLACYAGVAPFSNSSGTSVFGRNRVSVLADKTLKRVLHLGAMRAIQMDNDMSAYYKRKVAQGKNKMAVLNAVRNKIIHIVFALVKNETFYQNRLLLS